LAFFEKFQSVDIREFDIQKKNINVLPGKNFQSFFAVCGQKSFTVLPFELALSCSSVIWSSSTTRTFRVFIPTILHFLRVSQRHPGNNKTPMDLKQIHSAIKPHLSRGRNYTALE